MTYTILCRKTFESDDQLMSIFGIEKLMTEPLKKVVVINLEIWKSFENLLADDKPVSYAIIFFSKIAMQTAEVNLRTILYSASDVMNITELTSLKQ
uniref:Uncharacterized protein n=1 Tax=Romanomermis culicivorax TaxID=13658 RepID=A0A915JAI1_ROMCU